MSLDVLTYLFIGGSFALYIGIAIWARAGSTKEFYVAGGGVHPDGKRYGNRSRLDVCCFLHLSGGPSVFHWS